jgi:hypothetical protein
MTGFYEASRIRATKAEMADRLASLLAIVAEIQPATVRQVFYQATVRGLIDKTEAGYNQVQRALVDLRRSGRLPYHWIADNTRWQRKPKSYDGVEQALRETARLYRRNLWSESDCYVEVWLEKDALSGVLSDITAAYDVPLMVARGYASLSFLHTAAEYIATLEKPAFIYHLGDYDPSGVNAALKIKQTLRELAPKAEIHFERLAVLPWQVSLWDLPTRPTKTSDTRSKGFGTVSVELDAIPPGTLRAIVQCAIEEHMPADRLAILRVAEESEREILVNLWRSAA